MSETDTGALPAVGAAVHSLPAQRSLHQHVPGPMMGRSSRDRHASLGSPDALMWSSVGEPREWQCGGWYESVYAARPIAELNPAELEREQRLQSGRHIRPCGSLASITANSRGSERSSRDSRKESRHTDEGMQRP
jgi:hypothetical protein